MLDEVKTKLFRMARGGQYNTEVNRHCPEHESLQSKLSRIEGENIVIISLLAVVITCILTRVV